MAVQAVTAIKTISKQICQVLHYLKHHPCPHPLSAGTVIPTSGTGKSSCHWGVHRGSSPGPTLSEKSCSRRLIPSWSLSPLSSSMTSAPASRQSPRVGSPGRTTVPRAWTASKCPLHTCRALLQGCGLTEARKGSVDAAGLCRPPLGEMGGLGGLGVAQGVGGSWMSQRAPGEEASPCRGGQSAKAHCGLVVRLSLRRGAEGMWRLAPSHSTSQSPGPSLPPHQKPTSPSSSACSACPCSSKPSCPLSSVLSSPLPAAPAVQLPRLLPMIFFSGCKARNLRVGVRGV